MHFGSTVARVQSDIDPFTGSAVVKRRGPGRILPYALAGGAQVFEFRRATLAEFLQCKRKQTSGTFVYGLGADYVLAKPGSVRAEYRGLVYKRLSFNFAGINTDSWTNISQPSAGIVFRF